MKTNKRFWDMRAELQPDGSSAGHVYLYGIIARESWYQDEVSPRLFARDLELLGEVDLLVVHIFSDGGDVFAANAIYSKLKQHGAEVHMYVEGLAASAATIVTPAGDKVYVSRQANLMLHRPMLMLFGGYNEKDLEGRKAALQKIQEPIIATYAAQMDKSRDEVLEILDGVDGSGTWFTAQEAIDIGLADDYIPAEMEEQIQAVACIGKGQYEWQGHTFDLSQYKNAPEVKAERSQNMSKPMEQTNSTKPAAAAAAPAAPATEAPVAAIQAQTEAPVVQAPAAEPAAQATPAAEAANDFNKGVVAERERIMALDSILAADPASGEIVAKAKAEGWSFEQASREVFKAQAERSQAAGNAGAAFLAARESEAKASGALNVGAAQAPDMGMSAAQQKQNQAAAAIIAGFGQKKKGE